MQQETVNNFQESFDTFCAAPPNSLCRKGCGVSRQQWLPFWTGPWYNGAISRERMRHVTLLEELEAYRPWNDQEERDRAELLRRLRSGEALYTRDNAAGHLTASAWVVSPDRTQVLMAYHNLYDSWSWLGGHADGETDLLAVALREVKEEAGIANVRPVSPDIYSLESLTVDGHVKKGQYVSSHLHLNVTYLLEADSDEAVSIKEDENSGVAWFTPEEALAKSTEPWFVTHVYAKLIDKLKSSDL